MLLYVLLYEKIRAFSGGEILEPKQTLVAGGICSRRENCWQETRQQHVARFEDHLFYLKNARILRCAVGEAQETGWSWPAIFFRHKNDPLKTETRRRAWAPQRSPLKSECLMVTILPV